MQYADLMRPDEDWRELGDPSERRKIQNRIAQRAYRRNMRKRATKIDELKKQLRTYEEFHLLIAQDEDTTYQQNNDPSLLPPNRWGAGDWCPPQEGPSSGGPSKEQYHGSFSGDSPFSRVQQQVCPAPMEQHSANSSRPGTRQGMDCWAPTNSQMTVADPLTPAPSLQIEGGAKPGGITPLSSADLSAATYDDFAFDMDDLVNTNQQSTSLLHMAVTGNHVDTIKVLLQDERVTIDDKDSNGFTPLQRAVMDGRSEIVRVLLEHGSANTGAMTGDDLALGDVGAFRGNYPAS